MPPDHCTMAIFGGTGDLAHRKLVPALYNLHLNGQLPSAFSLVGIGRKEKTDARYREDLAVSVREYSASTWKEDQWSKLAANIYYRAGDLQDESSYPELKKNLEACYPAHGSGHNYLYYLAVAPQLFNSIAGNLSRLGMAAEGPGWRRILIEKPFGYNLSSARELNAALCAAFHENNIYRIDHYLGKEMLQNILVIRFANTVFEPLWNNRFIDHVQISAAESDGIGDRGRYYDRAGAMRDMVQSHLLQMLAVTAMEPPVKNDPASIRIKKLELLSALQLWPANEFRENVIFGQYKGFLQEKDISPNSQTETFAAVKLAVNNARWQGVPFYLRTGKKLQDKLAKVVIQFKKPVDLYFPENLVAPDDSRADLLNLLTLKIQPREGVVFQFNIKKPASTSEIVPVDMDFCQPCAFLINTPEAYERLLSDAMSGDSARFTAWDEVESCWKLVDDIYSSYRHSEQPVYAYEPGVTGPPEALEMLSRIGRRWWD